MAELTAYEEVFHYLRDNKYPDSYNKDQKRNLRKRSQKFVLENGVLFYKGSNSSELRRWVPNVDEQTKILTACHSDKLAGHFGRDKTKHKVAITIRSKLFNIDPSVTMGWYIFRHL
jgi:hypothetical protein